jgi:outer membrane protein insertion porin family
MRQISESICRPLLALVATLVTAMSAHGQSQQEQQGPPTVLSIDVRYSGPAKVSKEKILAQMQTKIGQPYSNSVVEQDIRSLYQTGAVLNVRIFAEPEAGGVNVIVAIQTRSIIREIEIQGANRISAKKIRKKLKIKINSAVNEEELEKSRQDVIEMYQGSGFNDIDVKTRVDVIDEKRGTSRVVFTISEGVKGAIRAIRFEGNTAFKDGVLRKQMKTHGKTIFAMFDKSGRLDETQLQQDLDSVREWYQDHGYIDVEVKDVRKERKEGEKGPMIITVVIAEGIKYHVGKVTITGEKITTVEKIRFLLKMKEGNIYSPKDLHDDSKRIADAYGAAGYVDLELTPEGKPEGTGRIDVHYKIEEGSRSFVQRINIVGNTRTKDKVLRREVLVAPGDVYNTVRVDLTKKRLENLGYFSKVDTFPDDTGIAGRKDLTIQVEEKRTGSLSFGGGFSTVDSLVAFVELTQGNFDIADWPGFTGAGQKFRLRLQGGNERKDFLLALTEPWFLDRRLSLNGQLFFSEADYLSSVYDQRDYGFSEEIRKPLNAFMYVTLGYRREELQIYNVTIDASQALLDEAAIARDRSQVNSSIVFDRRDNPNITRHGQRISISPFIAGDYLGGNTPVYGFDAEVSQYLHLPWDTILLINHEVASVNSWGKGNDVSIFDLLFLGGSNNLRGFEFRDVGPRDSSGEPLGGRAMSRSTVEFTFPIIEDKARGAFFYDAGFVNPDPFDFGTTNLASDVGFGLRMVLPIGPLRIDYGIPIQKDGRSGGGKFNFNVGYQF